MKRIVYILGLVLFIIAACNEKWNEHYEEIDDSSVSSLNLLQYLKTQPNYSKFVTALEETGVAKELERDQNLTIWAVNNDAMDKLTEMQITFTDTFIMQYHVNYLSFGYSKLYDGLRMKSISGKYISVTMNSDSTLISNSKLINKNQFCKNGVVHEIDNLMKPVISIYEYLLTLGNEYSTIVDTIINANDTVFDPSNSAPIGVDTTGNTIYDSVFIIKNPLLEIADFKSEFSQLTMFLPNNSVIDNCLETLNNQLSSIGRSSTHNDTVIAFNWIKGALFYNNIIRDIDPNTDLISADNKVWRPSVQKIDPKAIAMSNGLLYNITNMKIPNNVYITRIKSLVHYYEFLPEDSATRAQYIQFYNTTSYGPEPMDTYDFTKYGGPKGVYTIVRFKGASPSDSLLSAVEFSPLKIETLEDNSILASEMLIPAGEYTLYLGFRSLKHPFVNVYINGNMAAKELNVANSNPWNYDRVTQTAPGIPKYDGLGGAVGNVIVDGNGLQHIKIKIEFNRIGQGTAEDMQPYHWALVPTANNY
ncbi:MAG: fasciclin domain-containing protein [Marinilabiliaceae bacterium]|nr:fasciclin domain-containing protein [Marinilabiliaceae bacterium]